MSSKTDAKANADLDSLLAGTYCAVLTAITNGAAGTVTESTDPGYARIAISWAAAASRAKSNNSDITFAAATQNNAAIVGFAIYAGLSGGSPLWIHAISPTVTYNTGYQPVITSGSLTVTEAAYA